MFKLLKHAVNLKNVNVLLGGGSMGKLFLKICFFALMTVCSFATKVIYAEESQQNNYPIILVNGFAGWGREEMLGVKYWGVFMIYRKI